MLFPIEKIDFQTNLRSDLLAYNKLDVYIPWKVKQVFEELGFENVEVFQTVNLARDICLAYEKSHLKQWKVRFSFGEKSFVRKLIEYPLLDENASAIINGIKKIFPIKLKRRNVRVYFSTKLNIYILSLINLRNNKLDLLISDTNCWINIFGKRYRLVDFIVFEVYKQFSPFKLLSRDIKLVSDICNLPFEPLLKDGILQPKVLIRLLKYSQGNHSFFDDKNLIHKCFMTYGGHLMDLIERAWEVEMDNPGALHINKLKETINKRLNLNDLNGRIISFYMDGSFAQILEEINPISTLIHRRKVSLLYKGLLSKVNATEESRKHAGYQLGRLCPLSTSEGQSVGLILHLASGTKFNEYDELLVPYLAVRDGKLCELTWLLPLQETNVYITDKQTWESSQPYLIAKFNNGYQVVERDAISYVFYTVGQVYSFGVNSISRLNNSENDRVTTGSNMCKQAIILANPKPCYVMSYFLREGVKCCPGYKQLSNVMLSNSVMAITVEDGNFELHKFGKWSGTNSGTIQMLQKVKSNELVPYMYGDGCLLLGQAMHVGYMQYEGYTFEDAVVVSKSGAEKLSSVHLEEIEVPVVDTDSGSEKVTKDLIDSYKYNLDNLDENGIVKLNSYLRTHDLLVAKTKPITSKEDSPEQKFMKTLIHGKSFNVVNSVYTLPQELNGSFVMSVSCILGQARKFPIDVSSYKSSDDLSTVIKQLSKLRTGGVEWEIYAQGLRGEKVRLSRELRAQLVKDMVALKNLESKIKLREKREILKVSKEECLYSIKIILLREKKLEIGDKLTGMHGNKGILSAILPNEDMPYTEEGEPLEIIISNLSVYGRLNLGQVSESYLSKLCYQSELLIKDPYTSRTKLEKLYELMNYDVNLSFDDWLQKSRLEGVRLFDNPSVQLNKAKLTELEGLVGLRFLSKLRDGKSGTLLDNPVHHGWISIMKLIHTSEGKFSSRSIGDYSHKFCQPSRGKRLFNHQGMAQKLGNMEIMGLLARNLHNFLHEVHLKSDYTLYKKWVITGLYKLGRLRNIQEHTEAFKVLLRYFNVLGIKVNIDYKGSF